ncbi:hypothetical protein [Deinococcus arenicola]|uniref:Holliday junction resolvase n=1 Tax=Deinococcus arenicola TaxID=2994950 RepID=A0ABU4DUX7_9DEIO|nr:hypothetical protein [Deinococcus sp. ZS9-10]MDV6376230.1 hypothetical protein [Deinococcus sp. ZS9-10]
MTAPTSKKRPVNSRRKGASAELEFAKALTALGHPAERGQQRKGGEDSPDVICPSLPRVHWEVKFYKTCQVFSPAMLKTWDAQARADAGARLPCVAHRWNGSRQWMVRALSDERGPYWQTLEDFIDNAKTTRSEP